MMGDWFKQLVTEADGKTHSVQRWMALYAFGHFHVMQVVNVFYLHQAFDMTAYAAGIGVLFATIGFMLGFAPGEKRDAC